MRLTPEQQDEVASQRGETRPTRRATVPALEEMLYEPVPVLDHGFIRVVDYMGDDEAIVQAARVSYGRGTRRTSEDQGLINYLMRHRHTTPFEMCEIKYHVSCRFSLPDNGFGTARPTSTNTRGATRSWTTNFIFRHPSTWRRRRRRTARDVARFSKARRHSTSSICCGRMPSGPIAAMSSCSTKTRRARRSTRADRGWRASLRG